MFLALKLEVSQQVIGGEGQGNGDGGPGGGLLMDTVGVSSSLQVLPRLTPPLISFRFHTCQPSSTFHLATFLVEDLIKYLDPEYMDRIAIPDASKLQFILAEEQFILSQVALLEQVEALVPMLDSAHIKAVPEHAARLQRLAQIHIQQQDQCVEITEESKALLEEYNKTTMLLSKQFVQWDELLCQLEAAKQVKPAEE